MTHATEKISVWRYRRLWIGVPMLGAAALVLLVRGLAILAGRPDLAWPSSEAAVALAIFVVGGVCEFIDAALGMGYGTTLTPLMLLVGFQPLDTVPAVLLSQGICGVAAAVWHHRDGNVDLLRDPVARRTAGLLSILSAVGAIAAVFVATTLPVAALKLLIGTIIVGVGLLMLFTRPGQFRYRPGHIVAVGVIAAFNKSVSGGGYGPLVTAGQVVSGLSTKQAVAITSLTESYVCFVGLAAYCLRGNPLRLELTVPLVLGSLLTVPLATLSIRSLNEAFVRRGVAVATVVMGALTLYQVMR